MEDSTKRAREEDQPEMPEAKRLRPEDLLFDILDEADSFDRDLAADSGDLDGVMRSLEAEISLFGEPQAEGAGGKEEEEASAEFEVRQPELGYLLEASDDELGLPPAEASTSSSHESGDPQLTEQLDGFSQIWGFEDGISSCCYDGLDSVLSPQAAVDVEEGLGFGAGFFDGDGGVFWPLDWPELAFRPETMPAV